MSDNVFAKCLHKSNIYIHTKAGLPPCVFLKVCFEFFLIMEIESRCLAQAGMELVL